LIIGHSRQEPGDGTGYWLDRKAFVVVISSQFGALSNPLRSFDVPSKILVPLAVNLCIKFWVFLSNRN
jgi:hypothetical protein